MLPDMRVTARALVSAKAHTAAVVLMLTLGIGANVAVLSVVRGVLLRVPRLPLRIDSRLALHLDADPNVDPDYPSSAQIPTVVQEPRAW